MPGPTTEYLADQIEEIRADVFALKTDMAVVKSDVATLKSDVSTLKVDLRALSDQFVEFRAEVRTILRLFKWAGAILGGFLVAAAAGGIWWGGRLDGQFAALSARVDRLESRMDRDLGEIKALLRGAKVAAGARPAAPK